MVVLERKRIVNSYWRGMFIFDFICLITLIVVMCFENYLVNFGKLVLVVKLVRLS